MKTRKTVVVDFPRAVRGSTEERCHNHKEVNGRRTANRRATELLMVA